MSKIIPRSQKKSDHKRLTQVDKIRLFYENGRKLSDELEAKRLQLQQVWNLICLKGTSAYKYIAETLNVSESHSYELRKQALELFGDVTRISKDARRAAMTVALERIAEKAEDAKEFRDAIKAHETLAKIHKLDQPDDDEAPPVELPSVIFVTSDPQILKPPAEDRDYEEA